MKIKQLDLDRSDVDKSEAAQLLAERFPFIDMLPSSSRERLFASTRVKRVSNQTRLIERGDRVAGAYLVLRGSLRVYSISPSGRECTLFWVEGGDTCVLALNCLFSEIRYPAWVESDAPETEIAIIPARIYRELFEQEAVVQHYTFDVLSSRTFELMTLLEEALSLGVVSRIVELLLAKSDDKGVVAMSHQIIASHLGTAREVVSRTLRDLARKGLVETHRGKISIVDASALAALGHES